MITLSKHAQERINQRLSGLVSSAEVINRVNQFSIRESRAYIEVKRMAYTEIADDTVKPDGIARGDSLVAVYQDGIILSVMLRKSWSNSPEYKKIYRKPNR